MAYGIFKDLNKRAQAYNVLRDKAFEIARNPKYDDYKRRLASMVYKFFDKISTETGIKNKIKQNQELANELHQKILPTKSLFII